MAYDYGAALAKARAKHARAEALKKELAELAARREQLERGYKQARVKAVIEGRPLDKPADLQVTAERLEALEAALPVITEELESELASLRQIGQAILHKQHAAATAAQQGAARAAYQKAADALSELAEVIGGGNARLVLGQGGHAREIEQRLPNGLEDVQAPPSPTDTLDIALHRLHKRGPAETLAMLETLCNQEAAG